MMALFRFLDFSSLTVQNSTLLCAGQFELKLYHTMQRSPGANSTPCGTVDVLIGALRLASTSEEPHDIGQSSVYPDWLVGSWDISSASNCPSSRSRRVSQKRIPSQRGLSEKLPASQEPASLPPCLPAYQSTRLPAQDSGF